MSTYSVSRTFLGDTCFHLTPVPVLPYCMYPMMIIENDRNYLKKNQDLIDRFSLGGKLYAN